MKVRYDEGPDEVEIAELRLIVGRGEAVEVPTELGKQLVKQGWEEAKQSKPGAARKED